AHLKECSIGEHNWIAGELWVRHHHRHAGSLHRLNERAAALLGLLDAELSCGRTHTAPDVFVQWHTSLSACRALRACHTDWGQTVPMLSPALIGLLCQTEHPRPTTRSPVSASEVT